MSRQLHLVAALLICFVLLPLPSALGEQPLAQTQIPAVEYDALVALYNSTDGANWTTTWDLPTDNPCGLYGVTCSGGHITRLNLYNQRLTGTIPPELGDLASLTFLNLSSNYLSGAIPAELGNLTSLQHLILWQNQLSGSIPAELGNLSALQSLALDSNELTGSIPPELGNLATLQGLGLSSNQLTGGIPPEIGNLASLQSLVLSDNPLGGEIPPEIGNLTSIVQLMLSGDELTGSIPAELGNLVSLEELHLTSNQLSGSIPPEFSQLASLASAYLDSNQLSGSLPPELGNMVNLGSLSISSNELSGSIPPELGNMAELGGLDLHSNHLTGNIPPELGNLTHLADLNLASNELTGPIPAELGNCARLAQLHLENNQLSDAIPAELGGLPKLESMNLNNNQLSGSIPPALGNLAKLVSLNLHDNQLTGSIPAELGQLPKLQNLYLHNNQLSGGVPYQLGNLQYTLRHLWLSSNNLTGELPLELANLEYVNEFHFEDTALCEPSDAVFQAWLSSIHDLQRTGVRCQPFSTHFDVAGEWWDGLRKWAPQNRFPRMLGDVNGDGKDDVVAFNPGSGVSVALSTGHSLGSPKVWSTDFAWLDAQNNWRALGDVNGDGREDVIGFKHGDGVYVGISYSMDLFHGAVKWLDAFQTWGPQSAYPRLVGDVNGDNKADLVAIHPTDGVYVCLSTGKAFSTPAQWSTQIGWMSNTKNWVALGDVDGDGDVDLVNFRYGEGVYVALSDGSSYGARTQWWTGLVNWGPDNRYPRLVGDVTGDGKADIVAYAPNRGGFVGVSTGAAFLKPAQWTSTFAMLANSYNLRALGDMNGDGHDDAVCFIYEDGVYVALSSWE